MGTPPDPEEATAAGAPAHADIPAATTLGPVHLTVADLDRSLAWYAEAIGLPTRSREDGRATLGPADRDLLVLTEQPGARPADGYTGLYHVALLLPERVDLAAWLAHVARDRVSLVGLSDHFVSEAIYLSDPDHHGLEIYWDRPRSTWEGQVRRMGTWPLDVDSLLSELEDPATAPFDGLPAGTIVGHVHLRTHDVRPTIAFYRDVLGFGLMAWLGDQAAFLSAGGYHHHLGANTWESRGAAPAPPDTATITRATILLPAATDVEAAAARLEAAGHAPVRGAGGVEVRDPAGVPLLLAAAA